MSYQQTGINLGNSGKKNKMRHKISFELFAPSRYAGSPKRGTNPVKLP
jgi:hypothetical protein